MRVILIGASGQLGQEFQKIVDASRLESLTHKDIEVTDQASVESALNKFDGGVVVNLAAFHNVNLCEEDPERTFAVNALGAYNVAKAAQNRKMACVLISTDYVFDGTQRENPYTEKDQPNPINIYGTSKLAAEHLVQTVNERALIIRTASLFGAVTSKKGWTFPELMLDKAKKGDALRVVCDQICSPTYTRDLATTILEIIGKEAYGLYHVTNEGQCSWYELARTVLELAKIEAEIIPVSSTEFPSVARRPPYSALASAHLQECDVKSLRTWHDAIRAYLIEKGVLT
jgi:dTDP-4-dehydrorhamnose reductase